VTKLSQDRRTPVLVALMLSMMLVAMDTTIVTTAVPQVVGDLGGLSRVAWIFSIYLLAQTVTIPIYGKAADLYGRKPVLVLGVGVFLLGSLLCSLAWDMASIVAFRVVQGLGAGAIAATVNTVAGDMYDVRERGRIQGWLSGVWGVSAVIAPVLGGLFAEYLSWRWIFLVNLPIGAVALLLIIRGLHERVEPKKHEIDYAGAGLLLVSAGLLVLGLLQGGTAWPWLSVPSAVVFAVSGVAAFVAVRVERSAAEPVMPIWLWTRRLTAGSYVVTLISGLVVIGLSVFLPTWAQSVLGLNPVAAGFVLAVMTITWPMASTFSGRLYLRIGFRDTALVGTLLALTSAVMFTLLPADTAPWRPMLASAVMGAGMGLIPVPLLVGLQATVGWAHRGVVTGGAMFSRVLGQSLGAAVFGAVANGVLLHHLGTAPDGLRDEIPRGVDGVSRALDGGHESAAAAAFLRESLHASTHAVFVGLAIACVLAIVVLLVVVPRHFEPVPDDAGRAPKPDETPSRPL
jgi:EmrB/QacA subfamily drug resistance transporter